MGTFLRPCVLSFAGYLSLSIATMVVLIGQKGCHVRHTYRPDFLAGTASNPLYTSTQIVRHPPPLGAHQPQRAADIGVFPVIIAHPYRDAAFLPVHRDSSPTLNSLFSVLPRGGIQKMLDALSTTDREDGVGADVHGGHELVAQDLEAITAITAIHSDVYDLSEISTWPRGGEALHLLKNGMVVSPQQAMYMETAGLMTSMHTQGMRWLEGRGNGMLPNIGRCVKPIEHREGEGAAERKKREFRWLSGLSDYSTRSHLKGACLLSGQQDVVDVSTNHKASAVLFSSVNTMYTSLVVAWISASFSLFYCMNALLNGYEDLLIGVAVVWNVVLAATSLAPQWYGDYSIPLNNIVLGLVLLGLAVVVHCTWSSDSSARAFGAKAADPKAFFRAPRTDLYMANQVGGQAHPPLGRAGHPRIDRDLGQQITGSGSVSGDRPPLP